MIDWEQLTPELLAKAGVSQDLGEGLRVVMDVLDPDNEHDLGGEAGVWFSGPIPYEAPADSQWTEAPAEDALSYLEREDRTQRITDFFERLKDDARQIAEQFGG